MNSFALPSHVPPSPHTPGLGAHATNSQFVSWQIKLPWSNKRDKECIVNGWSLASTEDYSVNQFILMLLIFINVQETHSGLKGTPISPPPPPTLQHTQDCKSTGNLINLYFVLSDQRDFLLLQGRIYPGVLKALFAEKPENWITRNTLFCWWDCREVTGGRARPVPGTSHHRQRMMERRDAVPVRVILWKPQRKAFHPNEPDRGWQHSWRWNRLFQNPQRVSSMNNILWTVDLSSYPKPKLELSLRCKLRSG